MKCSTMLHFIWFFTVCQTTGLGFPVYKGLKLILLFLKETLFMGQKNHLNETPKTYILMNE